MCELADVVLKRHCKLLSFFYDNMCLDYTIMLTIIILVRCLRNHIWRSP